MRKRTLQRKLAVNVIPDFNDNTMIDDLIVGYGRPEGLFASHEKRHTTAWQAIVDTVRSAVVGQRTTTAVANLRALIRDTLELPGASLGTELELSAHKRYEDAVQHSKVVLSMPDTDTLDAVRRAVVAFLTLRNLTPLSAVDTGPTSPGAGESQRARRLRLADSDDRVGVGQVREDVWGLFDFATLNVLLTEGTTGRQLAFGRDPGPGQRLELAVRTVAQHLASMTMAYPNAFNRASFGYDWIAKLKDAAEASGRVTSNLVGAVVTKLRDLKPWTPSTIDERTPNPRSQDRFSVTVTLNEDRDVTGIEATNRPPTVLRTGQGSHMTAYSLYCEALRRLVGGKQVTDAIAAVKKSIESKILMTERHDTGQWRELPGGSRRQYEKAKAYADIAIHNADLEELDDVFRLEELCKGWLRYVNARPLAAVSLGGPANNRNEARTLKKLRRYERAGRAKPDLRSWKIAWNLLDPGALTSIASEDRRGDLSVRSQHSVPNELPGITVDAAGDVAYVIDTYIEHMRLAFPRVVEDCVLYGPGALAYLLVKVLRLPDEDVMEVADARGQRRDMPAAMNSLEGMSRKRKAYEEVGDDDEWSEDGERERTPTYLKKRSLF